jgi:hypothetical protein
VFRRFALFVVAAKEQRASRKKLPFLPPFEGRRLVKVNYLPADSDDEKTTETATSSSPQIEKKRKENGLQWSIAQHKTRTWQGNGNDKNGRERGSRRRRPGEYDGGGRYREERREEGFVRFGKCVRGKGE